MFKRFTDRARKVAQLAEQEAYRYNHEYVGTEHVLMGLIRDADGVAACVLTRLNVNLSKLHAEIGRLILHGPGRRTMSVVGWTPRAKQAMTNAMQEARGMNEHAVGTEHVLLGLMQEEEGVAAQVLLNLGLNLQSVRAEVLTLLEAEKGPHSSDKMPAAGAADSIQAHDVFVPPRRSPSASQRLGKFSRYFMVELLWSLVPAVVFGLVAQSWLVFGIAAVLAAAINTMRRLG